MHKFIIAALFLSFSNIAFATDADTITFIHSKTKSAIIDECKKSMPGATDTICGCVGEKAQASLDDNALKQCPSDSGMQACVQSAVTTAAKIALSDDNLKACGAKTAS